MWACTRYGSATPSLGWVAFVSFGALYCLIPWIYNRPLYSLKLVDWRFRIATPGIVFYITAMWVSGIMQGLIWRAYTPKAIRLAPAAAAALAASRRARAAMRQNLSLAFVYNLLALPLAAFGHLTPLIAALAMSGSSLLVTLNALSVRRGWRAVSRTAV